MAKTIGLFDIQINGFAGLDFNEATTMTAAALDQALEKMMSCGVTAILPTFITASPENLSTRLLAMDAAIKASKLGALMIPGYHLEGPFLNALDGYAGCHPASAMQKPCAQLIKDLEAKLSLPILMITYAPEFDENEAFAHAMSAEGKLLSVGHSAADAQVIERAAKAGLRLSTHLGNGVPQNLHKLNNTIFAQLGCDSLSAGFIADGLHLPPQALKSLFRAKGLERSILVTDAVSAAAVPEVGIYHLAGFAVERTADGTVRVPGSPYLAGSSLTLDQAVRNVMQWNLASFDQAIQMAAVHPRNLLKETFERYKINLPESEVIWDENNSVIACRVGHEQRHYN